MAIATPPVPYPSRKLNASATAAISATKKNRMTKVRRLFFAICSYRGTEPLDVPRDPTEGAAGPGWKPLLELDPHWSSCFGVAFEVLALVEVERPGDKGAGERLQSVVV